MDLVKINELLLTNEIDYSSLLILYDLSNNTDLFKNYFINMRRIMHRRNIDIGNTVCLHHLVNKGYLQNNVKKIGEYSLVEELDVFYKRFIITAKGKKIVNDIKLEIVQEVDDWIDEYRKLWSENGKQLKMDAMGNKQLCIKKMREFTDTNPKYNKETILKAARYYIEEFRNNHKDFTYLTTAPYFISREKTLTGQIYESASLKLVDYCEIILTNNLNINNSVKLTEKSDLA